MPGDYPFENLGDDRFQQLCQSLLLRERTHVQCFPLGQADGGRDAVSYLSGHIAGERKPFHVFQVKFSNTGAAERDARAWLRSTLEAEVPNILRLASLGATEYVVMTNVAGTGRADVGSIDRISDLFAHALPIPAFCYWRDDISRRLDNAWDLKWVYPELMRGQDLLRAILEAGLTSDSQRRSNTLRSFLASQYHSDKQVRFRQVDLESPLLDLFIDVPLTGLLDDESSRRGLGRRISRRLVQALVEIVGDVQLARVQAEQNGGHTGRSNRAVVRGKRGARLGIQQLSSHVPTAFGGGSHFSAAAPTLNLWDDDDFDSFGGDEARRFIGHPVELGAAAFFLHPLSSSALPFVVLEGAPGQGKSTVTQFVCQAHRMRLLGMTREVGRLRLEHAPQAARLPIRADLRDFAAWLGHRNPFAGTVDGKPSVLPVGAETTLETFLAALISHQSGGSSFDVADLQEVARLSAVLIVLDGLDEVPDPKRRSAVVEAIRDGAQRLALGTASLQLIVTSRPAAFAASPGLPDVEFPRLQLGPVTKPLAIEYADRWLEARQVDKKERTAFRAALSAKLDLPHLNELARNPMQLAILLSLLNTRGVSLPEMRTALYTSYIEVFFGREAEKSSTVRDNRDLLLALHGYLAWLLHSEAETNSGDERGRISQDRLRQEVRDYLQREGHDARLIDGLFAGVTERVVALVSREQGMFEFEVQPLREYFAGRYLYQTSKYSRVGEERGGTKPDRFDQIARNPYWLNVTRFFAGFFDKGELPMLVERLQELANDDHFRATSHPSTVAATLLSDWVFAQTPRTVSLVAALVTESPRLKTLLAALPERGAAGDPLSLAKECGRTLVLDRAFDLLRTAIPWDYRRAIISLGVSNSRPDERLNRWQDSIASLNGQWGTSNVASRYTWLDTGANIGALEIAEAASVQAMFFVSPISSSEALLLAGARRSDLLAASPGVGEAALSGILAGFHLRLLGRPASTLLEALATLLDPIRRTRIGGTNAWVSQDDARAYLATTSRSLEATSQLDSGGLSHERAEQVRTFLRSVLEPLEERQKAERGKINPSSLLIELSRRHFGERWVHVLLATAAAELAGPRRSRAGPRAATNSKPDSTEPLLDHSLPLFERVLAARHAGQSSEWWANQLKTVAGDYDRALVISTMTAFASTSVLEANEAALDDAVQKLDPWWWHRVGAHSRQRLARSSQRTQEDVVPTARGESYAPRSDTDVRTVSLLQDRLSVVVRRQQYDERLRSYRGNDLHVLDWAQTEALRALATSQQDWDAPLRTIANSYAGGAYMNADKGDLARAFDQADAREPCEEILSRPIKYPQVLVALAERHVRNDASSRVGPLAAIAERERWFQD